MKILLANYRYFVSGGPERYMFNLTDALEAQGHDVIPFSIRYKQNRSTPYDDYFVEPLGNEDQVYFRDQNLNLKTVRNTLSRLFYAKDVEQAVIRLIEDTKPQVAYVLHYLRKLSPALLVGLHKAGLPIVVRLSDYAMVCPQAHCLRDAQPCELCIQGNLLPSIRYQCIQDSLPASALNAVSTWYHRYQRYFDLIDMFVTTNQFMTQMLLKAGISSSRISTIPTFVDHNSFFPAEGKTVKPPYVIYIGRLEEVKGLDVLINAWGDYRAKNPDSSLQLKIVGTGNETYSNQLKKICSNLNLDQIEFLGSLDRDVIAIMLRNAFMSIIPSLWYENLPNSLLESFASGTPVLASNIGSLRESIEEGETGYFFEPGDSAHLAERIDYCYNNSSIVSFMSEKVRHVAKIKYSTENHMSDLLELFSSLKAKMM